VQSVPSKLQSVPNHYLFFIFYNMINRHEKHVGDAAIFPPRSVSGMNSCPDRRRMERKQKYYKRIWQAAREVRRCLETKIRT
jgi:hypothetical protein